MRWRTVPDEQHSLAFWCVLGCKLREESLHARSIESRQNQPEDAPGSWMCRGIQPEPFVAFINDSQWALSERCPDTTQNRLEAKASFVLAPDFYFLRRVRLLQGLRRKFYLFLNSACSSADARRLFAGRGTCRLKPSRRMARHAVV